MLDLLPALLAGLAVLVACFLLGSTNPAAIIARALGRNLRTAGSGNPGATNAGRVLGVRWGVAVALLDVAKAYLPTLVLLHAVGLYAALAGGSAVVLGHVFSPFLGGRGGKGVATALGVFLGVAPLAALVGVVLFGVVLALVRYFGRASVVTFMVILLAGVADGLGLVRFAPQPVGWWLAGVSVLVIGRHHRNIRAWTARRLR